jgi:hypothetical protein
MSEYDRLIARIDRAIERSRKARLELREVLDEQGGARRY